MSKLTVDNVSSTSARAERGRVNGSVSGSGRVSDPLDNSLYSPNSISTIAIMDLSDMSMTQLSSKCLDQLKLFIEVDNCCYPETLGKMLAINAPWIAVTGWGLVKGWLDPRTQNKIEIVSPEKTRERLNELIDKEHIPPQYGGTGPDLYFPHPDCDCLWLNRGSDFSRVTIVGPGKGIHIDSYAHEAPIELTIISEECAETEKSDRDSNGGGSKRRSSFFGYGGGSTSTSANTKTIGEKKTHMKAIITPTENGSIRARHTQTLSKDDLGDTQATHKVTVTWKNTRRMSQTPLVYALTVVNLAEEEKRLSARRNSLAESLKESEDARESVSSGLGAALDTPGMMTKMVSTDSMVERANKYDVGDDGKLNLAHY
jgi:hypothetical protein